MQLSQNIRATRITGTLDVNLEDGRVATLEVDLDTSDPHATWGVDHEYAEGGLYTVGPTRCVSTTFSVRIPTGSADADAAQFTLRIPMIEGNA